jgi:hypothetical protein
MNGMGTANAGVLRELEESMWRAQTRFDQVYMDQVLHPAFFEFGRSGRQWTRDETLSAEPSDIVAELHEFAVHQVSDDAALVTYISVVHGEQMHLTNRSSLWVRADGRWLLRFHQGTPVFPM